MGQEAFERMSVVRNDSFDDPAWSEYILFTRHGERWYEVRCGIAGLLTSVISRSPVPGPSIVPRPPVWANDNSPDALQALSGA